MRCRLPACATGGGRRAEEFAVSCSTPVPPPGQVKLRLRNSKPRVIQEATFPKGNEPQNPLTHPQCGGTVLIAGAGATAASLLRCPDHLQAPSSYHTSSPCSTGIERPLRTSRFPIDSTRREQSPAHLSPAPPASAGRFHQSRGFTNESLHRKRPALPHCRRAPVAIGCVGATTRAACGRGRGQTCRTAAVR